MTKICKICEDDKPLSEFSPSLRHKSGCLNHCKKCINERSKERYKNNPQRHKEIAERYHINNPLAKRRTMLKYTFGISLDLYEELLKSQNYKCAICETDSKDLSRSLDVDHNHDTGKIRGLLCPKCNKAIGLFNDNPDILNKAISYLKT